MGTKKIEKQKEITQLRKNFIEFKNESHENRDNNHNYDLITESDLNQVKNLLYEYSVARTYLDENYSHIDSTILAMIYKKIINATPKWLPEIYTFKSFQRITSSRHKNVYGRLVIDKVKDSKYPKLLEEQMNIPKSRKYTYSILKMPLHDLIPLMKRYRTINSSKMRIVILTTIGAFLSIFSTAIFPPIIPLIICALCIIAGIIVYPKGLKSNIGFASISKEPISTYIFSGILNMKQNILISYYTDLKDEKRKQESPAYHLKQIKHKGTSWSSLEQKENN